MLPPLMYQHLTASQALCRGAQHAGMAMQAKAGAADAAFAVLEDMQRPPYLMKPTHYAFNTVLNAVARALPPRPAQVLTANRISHLMHPGMYHSLAVCSTVHSPLAGLHASLSMVPVNAVYGRAGGAPFGKAYAGSWHRA